MNRGRTLATVLVVLLAGMAGCQGTGSNGETHGVGETVALEQENTTIEVTLEDYRFEDSFEAENGTTVQAPRGEQFLFLKVSANNVGDEDGATPAVGVRPSNDSAAAGRSPPTWDGDGWYRSIRQLRQGETKRGWVLRLVPDDAAPADVKVAFSTDILITSGEYAWRLSEPGE